jgi:hypothetical protein
LESLDASSHQLNVLLAGRRNQTRKRQVLLRRDRRRKVLRRRGRRIVLRRRGRRIVPWRRRIVSSSSLAPNHRATTARLVWFAMEKRFKRE